MLVDGVLKATLVHYLPSEINVYTRVPADPQLPYVYIKHVGGADIDEEIDSLRAAVLVRAVADSLVSTDKVTSLAHNALMRAEAEGLVTPFGGIEWVNRYQYPKETRLKQQPENETIMESMYEITMVGNAEAPKPLYP